MSAGRGHVCPIRRKSRSLRSVITRCLRQDASIAALEEILKSGAGTWTWTPSLGYRRDPFSRDGGTDCKMTWQNTARAHKSAAHRREFAAR